MPRPYGRIVRDGDGRRRARSSRSGRDARAARDRELNASIYVFGAGALWRALERLEPQNAQGELYLTDAVAHLVAAGGRVVVHRPAPTPQPEGVNTRAELAAAAAALRDRINEAHMLAGVTIVDPASDVDRADVELEADAWSIRSRSCAADSGRRRRRDRSARGRRRRRDRARGDRRAVLLPSPRDGSRGGREGGHLRGDQELAHRERSEGAAPLLHRRRRHRRGHEHRRRERSPRTSRHRPGGPKGRTTIGKNVRTGGRQYVRCPGRGWRRCLDCGRDGDHRRRPAGIARRFPPRQVNKEGYVRARARRRRLS